jgi:hypothetical protein
MTTSFPKWLRNSVIGLMTVLLWVGSSLPVWAISLPGDIQPNPVPLLQGFSKLTDPPAMGATELPSLADLTQFLPQGETISAPGSISSAPQLQIEKNYGNLPISFEANQGQTDEQVDFLSRGNGYSLFLAANQAVLSLAKSHLTPRTEKQLEHPNPPQQLQNVVRMTLMGSNPTVKPDGLDRLEGKSNYLIGNDPRQWHTDIPNYGRVKYSDIYPGIDLVYYGNQHQLEYDFLVRPGANPAMIKLQYEGTQKLSLNQAGDLILETANGDVIEKAPVVYQEVNGKRQSVTGAYQLLGNNQVAFKLGQYDTEFPVVIDPVLLYSTYWGGSSNDSGSNIAIDGAGNVYITGLTSSNNFPTLNAFRSTLVGNTDVFVSKINASGNGIVYSTYLGGSNFDFGYGIAVDSSGNAYIGGFTNSNNFPLQNPLQASLGGVGFFDAFVSKLNASGNGLVYSTFLGGSNDDFAFSIAVDNGANAYVTGITGSSNFPIQNALQVSLGGGNDGFVSKINAAGNSLTYSTYLGGNNEDSAQDIALDSSGNAYITGITYSLNFPTQNPLQVALGGSSDGFVSKLNAAGNGFVYSTYLGGSNGDFSTGIAVDRAGNTYLTGYTSSTNFPIQNALQSSLGGFNDAFISKINSIGNSLIYSTYLGGSSDDYGNGIAVSSAGNAFVTGYTGSPNFPTKNPLQGTSGGQIDAFVSKINGIGNALAYSTYLGGVLDDYGDDIALDSIGSAYIAGDTYSSNFPTQNALRASYSGSGDAFVGKISGDAISITDFNKDVKPDLLWRNENGTLVAWYMNSFNLVDQAYLNPSGTSPDWKVANTSDFNNDGNPDILWRNDNGVLVLWYMNGINFSSATYVNPSGTSPDWKVAGIADFNQDTYLDLLWRNDNGVLVIWFMNGSTQVSAAYLNPSGTSVDWKVAGLADFNNDTQPDILWRNDNGTLVVWYMNGINQTGAAYLNPSATSTDWTVSALADANNDGNTDIIWRNTDGTLAYWAMNGITATSSGFLNPSQVATSWKIAAPR